MKYIALLRGINIGRNKRIKMADLVKTLESLGFKNVKTYLQSGNVIFEHDSSDIMEIAGSIERKISQTFPFYVDVIIRTKDELENIVKGNPFIKEPDIELDKLHVTFLADIPDQKAVLNLDVNVAENEKFEIIGREVYLYCPNGYSRTKLKNDVFERKLNTTATTRNWKTTNKLFELSS
ncbi:MULTISPECIES: DUF1697 domain-containing protein [Methanobacterium]|jgi:uncharacterized protein (DUF1697 family)|uniref:DUF1697 domain-containing protein n=1 Tax=Methanobacterium veterum TaxID=408577 RepID=A0A9E4ZX99_9EURY|nr:MULTISPECIES: DUF1697 domain-containing protein [Methanobacterium]MCZ3365796.1 DUF1697 domain-containing protein [Methanobacterium veterum]MCZ3371260.1 DUF1697 domain-containing protein [Methanobacterium veterum]